MKKRFYGCVVLLFGAVAARSAELRFHTLPETG